MEITDEQLTKLNTGLKKICDCCDDQAFRLREVIDGLDEISSQVQILWGELAGIAKQGQAGPSSLPQSQQSPQPDQASDQ